MENTFLSLIMDYMLCLTSQREKNREQLLQFLNSTRNWEEIEACKDNSSESSSIRLFKILWLRREKNLCITGCHLGDWKSEWTEELEKNNLEMEEKLDRTHLTGDNMPRDILEGNMDGKRGKGRPWIGVVSALISNRTYDTMKKAAKDREERRRN